MSAFDRWLTTDPREEAQYQFERWCEANKIDPCDPTANAQYEKWWDEQGDDG